MIISDYKGRTNIGIDPIPIRHSRVSKHDVQSDARGAIYGGNAIKVDVTAEQKPITNNKKTTTKKSKRKGR